jgi:hypothetical protein
MKSLEKNKDLLNSRIVEFQKMKDSLDHKGLENKLLLFSRYKEKTLDLCVKLIQ